MVGVEHPVESLVLLDPVGLLEVYLLHDVSFVCLLVLYDVHCVVVVEAGDVLDSLVLLGAEGPLFGAEGRVPHDSIGYVFIAMGYNGVKGWGVWVIARMWMLKNIWCVITIGG